MTTLTAEIDALQQRIDGDAPSAGCLIDGERLQRVLIGAAALQLHTAGVATTPELAAAVHRFIRSGVEPDLLDCRPSILHTALIQLGDHLFHYLETSLGLDTRAFEVVRYLQPGLVRILVAQPGALLAEDSAARRFLELLVDVCRGYDRFSGRGAEALIAGIGEIVQTVVAAPGPPQAGYAEAADEVSELLDGYNRETSELAKDTITRERGTLQSNDARVAVNREIIKAVSGKRLPPLLLEFLQKTWSKYLYVTYLRQGMQCEAWHQGVFDIHILVQSLSKEDRDDFLQSHADQLTKTLDRVKQGTASIHTDEKLARLFLSAMDVLLAHVEKGRIPGLAETVQVAAGDFPVDARTVATSPEDLPLIETLRLGDWFRLRDSGLLKRCRLIDRNRQFSYCLFTNYSGIKVARRDFPDLAAAIRSGDLQPITATPVFADALAFACTQIRESLIPELEARAAEVERTRNEALERRRRADEAERLRRSEDERLREKVQRLKDKLRRQQEQARRAAEARAEADRQAQERALRTILEEVAKLQPGASLELIGDRGERIYCKLGLKIKSSGKLIFVDRLGSKTAELMPRGLALRIMEGSASIRNFGVAFEETLKSLIADRSEKIEVEEKR